METVSKRVRLDVDAGKAVDYCGGEKEVVLFSGNNHENVNTVSKERIKLRFVFE